LQGNACGFILPFKFLTGKTMDNIKHREYLRKLSSHFAVAGQEC